MDQHNPYAAPQIAEFATPIMTDGDWTPADALGPEWRKVCAGAKKLYTALLILILSFFLMILLAFLVVRNGAGGIELMGIVSWAVVITVWAFQLIGQIQLNKVSPVSGAKGVLNASLIAFIVVSAGSVLLNIISRLLFEDAMANAGPGGPSFSNILGMGGPTAGGIVGILQFVLMITQHVCFILLLIGLRRIGTALRNSSIVTNSTTALVLYCSFLASLVALILFGIQAVRSGPGAVRANSGFAEFGILFGLGVLIGSLVFLVVYSNALKKIGDFSKSSQWNNI